jgi:hypothetical protein
MDDYLVAVLEQRLRGCPAQPVGGTGDEDARHVLPFAAPLSSGTEYLAAWYRRSQWAVPKAAVIIGITGLAAALLLATLCRLTPGFSRLSRA